MSFEDDFEVGDNIQESPIPDVIPNAQSNQGVAQNVPNGQVRQSSMPDPNTPVTRPQNVNRRNYDSMSQSGARQGQTQEINQGFAQPGQHIMQNSQNMQNGQNVQRQQRQPMQNGQNVQRQPMQNGQNVQNMQNAQNVQRQPRQQRQPMQNGQNVQRQPMQNGQRQPMQNGQNMQRQPMPNMQGGNVPPNQRQPMQGNMQPPKKKKGGVGKILAIVAVLAIVAIIGGVVAVKYINGNKLVAAETDYNTSGRYALDTLQNALNNYDATAIDAIIGTEDGDSYIAQEWAYVNKVYLREEFIEKVCATVKFEYPTVQQLSTTGVGMTDESGNAIMIESYMNNGEELTITYPDYDKITQTMDEKADYIKQLLKSSKYTEADYSWEDELTNLMIQFILDDGDIPTKTTTITFSIRLGVDGTPYIESDADLDDLLFGSEEFHDMNTKFAQICYGWTGYKDEYYTVVERQHNEEYDEWLELFLVYFEADGGIYDATTGEFSNVQNAYNKRKSKWEPWYLRDDDNNIQKNEDGTYIVNYFSVKDENGNDWIQPAEEIEVEVEKTRQVEDPWVTETGILFNWIGQHYLETYTGLGSTVVRVGDGSIDYPAGIGTTIITKVLCTDGTYHDVKVAMMGYWTGEDAINYAEKFSSKNRGFTTSSVVQLICYEIYVENLEDEPITFESSEMTLADKNANLSSRTGTMYGFTTTVTLAAQGDKQNLDETILNDWATSTELSQKYVCWGKSFGRTFSLVYFDCLAGTGEIPSYSAYEQFITSYIDEDDTTSSTTTTTTETEATSESTTE